MPEDTITITLSDKADIDWLRAKVHRGELSSESEAVTHSIGLLREEEQERDLWSREDALACYESYRVNPSGVFTPEEVLGYLDERRKERATESL